MMDRAVNVGDVVKLNSGGPIMTVVKRVGDDIWKCTWFKDNILYTSQFSSVWFGPYHKPLPESSYWWD